MVVPKEIKNYAIANTKAKRFFSKYEETKNAKYKAKADYYYGIKRGYELKFSNPTTDVNNNSINIKDSFKSTKSKTTRVPIKVNKNIYN